MRITLLITFTLCFLAAVNAQERLSGLVVNPQVKNALMHRNKSASAEIVRTTLPFFDDFSQHHSIFPDQKKWTDNYVFINSDYALNPPTVGVATFDAIDNLGQLYSQASSFPFGADTLTSAEIRLDSLLTDTPRKLLASDSVYLSFYYQPQGLGNSPSQRDSLILEFLAPDEDFTVYIPADTVLTGGDTIIYPADTIIYENWVRVWSSAGESIETFYGSDSVWFKQALVPIRDEARFFKPDFRFRFVNYASLADATLPDWQSNGDQWNIDYVYLDYDRTINDTTHPDIAFASEAPSMLRNYTSMPYQHYKKNFIEELAKNIQMKIVNLDSEPYEATYKYFVTKGISDTSSDTIRKYDGGNYSIQPYIQTGYVDFPKFSNPPVEFIFPLNEPDFVSFEIKHVLDVEANQPTTTNDTVIFNQTFSNYFSYDDGTAEAGYGITPAWAQVAYKFQLNKVDSLFGVNMFFNQTLTQGNVNDFYLTVWNDEFGEPGEIIYSRFGYEPVYTDSLNQFFFYQLDSAINIEPGNFPNLIFYVGWEQSNERMLNIGFDKNNDASQHTFYRTFGEWSSSQFQGALMIRPVVGTDKIVAMEEKTVVNDLTIYPNPANTGIVRIKSNINPIDFNDYYLRISTMDGRIIETLPLVKEINVSGMANGLYFIHLIRNNSIVTAEKLIINR